MEATQSCRWGGRGCDGQVELAEREGVSRGLAPTMPCSSRYQRKYLYQNVSRTLCQPQTKSEMETQFFYVDVSTLSAENASYQLQVMRVENFVLR